jgi:membrane-associated phospholipid phosphatase
MTSLNTEPRLSTCQEPAPLSKRFSTFAIWGFWVGVAFFSVYPATNWLTSLRTGHHALYFREELQIPFVPSFIWLYMSMYLLFLTPPFFLNPSELRKLAKELIGATVISGALFLAFPARLGFPRTLPDDEFYRSLYAGLFSVDHPFNLAPSLHVVYTTAIIFAIIIRLRVVFRHLLFAWLILIVSSTILVHQHHLLDVASGIVLAILMRSLIGERNA